MGIVIVGEMPREGLALVLVLCVGAQGIAQGSQLLDDAPRLGSPDSDQEDHKYSPQSVAGIIAAQKTPTAKQLAKNHDSAPNATTAARLQSEYFAYMAHTEQQLKDNSQERKSKIVGLSAQNAAMQNDLETDYATKVESELQSRTELKQGAITNVTALKKAHFEACAKLKANNPYVAGSVQFEAAASACKDESDASLQPIFGSKDGTYGPSLSTEGFSPQEQAKQAAKEQVIRINKQLEAQNLASFRKEQAQIAEQQRNETMAEQFRNNNTEIQIDE